MTLVMEVTVFKSLKPSPGERLGKLGTKAHRTSRLARTKAKPGLNPPTTPPLLGGKSSLRKACQSFPKFSKSCHNTARVGGGRSHVSVVSVAAHGRRVMRVILVMAVASFLLLNGSEKVGALGLLFWSKEWLDHLRV